MYVTHIPFSKAATKGAGQEIPCLIEISSTFREGRPRDSIQWNFIVLQTITPYIRECSSRLCYHRHGSFQRDP
jgi:hypothetical protein